MNIFEQIKQTENNREFWSARELQPLLGYSKWENFQQTISRAMQSCETAGYSVLEHFPEVRKMFIIGNGAQREQQDYQLSLICTPKVGLNNQLIKVQIFYD